MIAVGTAGENALGKYACCHHDKSLRSQASFSLVWTGVLSCRLEVALTRTGTIIVPLWCVRDDRLGDLNDQVAVLNHCIKKVNHIQYLQVLHDLVRFSEQMLTVSQTACLECATKSIESLVRFHLVMQLGAQEFVIRLQLNGSELRPWRWRLAYGQ